MLKYYPLTLPILLVRERRRVAVSVVTAIGLTLISLSVYFHLDVGTALANIPAQSYFADNVSPENLPFGFGEAFGNGFARITIDASLWSLSR